MGITLESVGKQGNTSMQGRMQTRFVVIVGYHPGRHLEYIKCWVMQEWQHSNMTRMMFEIQESVKKALWMQIPGLCQSQERLSYIFCNQLSSWRPSCPHSESFKIFFQVKCLGYIKMYALQESTKRKVYKRSFKIKFQVLPEFAQILLD